MGGILTQQCSARGDFDGDVDVRGHINSRSRRRSVSVKRAGFHVTGPWRGGVPWGVVCIDRLASEGVLVVCYCR